MVNERLKWLAGIGFVLALTVVVLGAWTRLVDAGLGCPDWPGCYGFIAVPQTAVDIATAQARFPDVPVEAHKAWPEMVHRYFATTLGLVIVITAVYAWMKRSPGTPVGLLCVLVVLVIVQGAFGAWTVTLKLWPQVVTAHLLGGFATLSLLWLLLLRLGVGAQWRVPRTVKNLAIAALAVGVGQISLG
ncbi:MAG: COX15/CtaA family protein, partial [Proteobacteria bacterium]|nr:COX15/CtaA family protein [Pseudomonadota bacterium]